MPLFGEDRFRMELHAIGWLVPMCDCHDLALLRARCHREMRRACLIKLNNKGMVASNAKRGGELVE